MAVPEVEGVKTPEMLTVPILDGLSDHVTSLLKLPVPVTTGVHVDVCCVRIDDGEQVTVIEMIVDEAVMVTCADPDFVASSEELAVMVAVPAADGVNTPADVIEPSVADQVTAEL